MPMKSLKNANGKLWAVISTVLFTGMILFGFCSDFQKYRDTCEPEAEFVKTSTRALVSQKQFLKTITKYEDLNRICDTESIMKESYTIPGLESARSLLSDKSGEIVVCTSMTPQGICTTEDYLLISAYCHTGKHNSVIYVIDKESHSFIKEVVLPGKPHVGSLAYDPDFYNIWIAGSCENTPYANAVSLSELEKYQLDVQKKPIRYEIQYPVNLLPKASFLSYNKGSLFIGSFSENQEDRNLIARFRINQSGALKPETMMIIPGKCQGVAFWNGFMLLSLSQGNLDSKLQILEYTIQADGTVLDAQNCRIRAEFTLPPMLEQIHVDEQNDVYMIFESGAYAYRTRPIPVLDRVLKIHPDLK